jgi:glycerol-3-phosphate acyltransferase PlsY
MLNIAEIATLIIAYLIGSIPVGLIVARFNQVDITAVGSGNVGATNVARTLGKKAGICVLVLDCSKGILPMCLVYILGLTNSNWIPFAVVSGHCFSLPGLKGGKGVATALGTLIAYTPVTAIVSLLFFAITFYKTRIVSLSSIVATWAAPIFILISDFNSAWIHSFVLTALLITYRHKDNIDRITKGTESKFKV